MATEASKVWKKFGALNYKECVGQDLNPNTHGGKMRGFKEMAKLKKGETVWFSYIEYKSKTHRDQVNKKVMAFFDKKYANAKDFSMPFDMKRMAYGGFTAVVE